MKFKTIGNAKNKTELSYLGSVNSSSKIAKNEKYSGVTTYVLYLAPAETSGFNVCPMATEECKAGCLNTSGRVKMDNKNIILNSRIKKTRLFFEEREFFMDWLFAEIKREQEKAIKKNMNFSVRLNGTSDINWLMYKVNGKNVFETFPTIQFYDYTKVANRFNKILPNNYHLTLSYTGYNLDNCLNTLSKGNNIAVIFNVNKNDELPKYFKGYKVIDGDLTDYRPNDGKGVIIGLRWKNIKNKLLNNTIKNSVFVVQKEDFENISKKVA